MTIKDIYKLAIEMGSAADPRGKKGIEKHLEREKKLYQKLSHEDKEYFDKDRLFNPYADSRILTGDPLTKVKTAYVGIDVEVPEIALLKALNKEVDVIIHHHPMGKSLVALDQAMRMQADFMAVNGVPINIAEGVNRDRLHQIMRNVNATNYLREIQAAKMAGIPLLNLHSTCDALAYKFLQDLMDRKSASWRTDTVGEIIDILKKIPEYKVALEHAAGPVIIVGSPENRAGKVVAFDTVGGTSPAKEAYVELARAGVGTIIGMHMRDDARDLAIKHHLNVVLAGHMASDSLGMNILLDKLAAKGIKIIPIGGLIRVRRKHS